MNLTNTAPENFPRYSLLKRAFDILFSLAVLIVGSPIFALFALLIRVTSKGEAIYAQQRVGRGGKIFTCYKFRTMHVNAEELLEKLLTENPSYRAEWEQKRKLSKDPRITSIGRFLRVTSLDELPQFWNVLIGDLSVVGPRPVCVEEIQKYYGEKSQLILRVRPGITGLWQTSDRREMSYSERICLDEQYIKRQSFFLDLALVVKTVWVMVSPKGAC